MRPHLLRSPGLAVYVYSFALDASDLRPPRLLQHPGDPESWFPILDKGAMKMRTLKSSGVHAPNWVKGAALWLACGLLATGCASAVAIRVPEAGPQSTCVAPAPEPEIALGVALSGGGSRAAV